jgi:hypothetical protein
MKFSENATHCAIDLNCGIQQQSSRIEAGISHLKYFPNGHVKKEYAVIPPRILQNQARFKELMGKRVRYAVSR